MFIHWGISKEAIIRSSELLSLEIPGITIRTSLTVGFPGETEKTV